MNIDILHTVVTDQLERVLTRDEGITRDIDYAKVRRTKQITVITGVRRSGKSTLMLQLARQHKQFYYLNFDDDRLLQFTVEDFGNLMQVFRSMFESEVIALDEIQNVPSWERFVRRIHDEGFKVYLTGSNAKLLSSELATHLTGRYIRIELYPFSLMEVFRFRNIDPTGQSTTAKAKIRKTFLDYLEQGGFPEYLKYQDQEFLKRVYDDIIYKDLIVRYGIRNISGFKKLSQYLFTNVTGEISYNGLKEILGFSSVASVREYISYLSEAYLLFEVYKYDASLKRQYISNKKGYIIDNGLRNIVAFRFSPDTGKLLENLVFLNLKKRYEEVFFYKTRQNLEVDFYIPAKKLLFQVSHDITNEKTKQREIRSLFAAMQELKVKVSFLFTSGEETVIKDPAGTIHVVPAWKSE
jgi:predicted AAA+ superfamily ATPase